MNHALQNDAAQWPETQKWLPIKDEIQPLSSRVVTQLNTLYMRNTIREFSIADESYTFMFNPDFEYVADARHNGAVHFIVKTGENHSFCISLKSIEVLSMMQVPEPKKIPEKIKLAIFEAYLETLLEDVELFLGNELTLARVEFADSIRITDRYKINFNVTHKPSGKHFKGFIAMDDEALALLSEGYELLDVEATFNHVADIPLPVSIQFGSTGMTMGQISELDIHDIIVTNKLAEEAGQGVIYLRACNRWLWHGKYTNSHIQINTAMEAHMDTENTPPQAAQAGDDSRIEDLSVELLFEVGKKILTVKQLKALKPGYTFEIEQPLSRAVNLIVNNRKIGTGEIMRVGENLGIRILELDL